MQAWTSIIVFWFLTLLFTIFLVSYFVYKEIYTKRKKTKFYGATQLQPWFLLLLFSAAITIVLIWYLLEQNHHTIYNINSANPWLFLGLTVGLFAIISTIVTCVLSTRSQSDFFATNSPTQHTDHQATIDYGDKGGGMRSGGSDIGRKINSDPSDEILVLRNLSEPAEDFVIDLSNPSTPVSKRKSFSLEDNELEMELPDGMRPDEVKQQDVIVHVTAARDFNC